MQKHVNLVDLVKSFPTNIYLQNLASIQKRTRAVKFAHLAEKSGKGSISNLSTKVPGGQGAQGGLRHGRTAPLDRAKFTGLVLGCIEAKFCKQILVGKLLTRSTRFTCFCAAPISKVQRKTRQIFPISSDCFELFIVQ